MIKKLTRLVELYNLCGFSFLLEYCFHKNNDVYSNRMIETFLMKQYATLINQYSLEPKKAVEVVEKDKFNIWVLWWQGVDDAPDIVKKCLKTIKKILGNIKLSC